jgi:hypothetical protein
MTITTIRAMHSDEVAYVLRQRLGPCCDWHTQIADMRRGKHSSGPVLSPIEGFKDSTRPLYSEESVAAYIKAYLAFDSNAQRNVRLKLFDLEINTPAPTFRLIKRSSSAPLV